MSTVLKVALATLILLGALELGLRLTTDAPRGIFLQMVLQEDSLYPRNSQMPRLWGEFPYLIKSNNLGFRGNSIIAPQKSKDKLRVAMMGDSITDGFFVDNEDSYPFLLEESLQRHMNVEVINGAKGGGTVHKQYAIYRKYVKKLDPDIVVLTFVSNDLNEFDGLKGEELLSYSVQTARSSLANWLTSYTALGESALDLYLRVRLDGYSTSSIERIGDPRRYAIAGNTEYRKNALKQVGLSRKYQNLVLQNPESRKSQAMLENYLFVLGRFNQDLVASDSKFLFVYFPSYSQVYLDDVSMQIRDQLREFCADNKIRFLDLSAAFRDVRYEAPLHLAPVDFHLNPAGNRLLAASVAARVRAIADEPAG